MQVHIIDNFLSEEDCDYLIQYYKDYKNKDKPGRKINYGWGKHLYLILKKLG